MGETADVEYFCSLGYIDDVKDAIFNHQWSVED